MSEYATSSRFKDLVTVSEVNEDMLEDSGNDDGDDVGKNDSKNPDLLSGGTGSGGSKKSPTSMGRQKDGLRAQDESNVIDDDDDLEYEETIQAMNTKDDDDISYEDDDKNGPGKVGFDRIDSDPLLLDSFRESDRGEKVVIDANLQHLLSAERTRNKMEDLSSRMKLNSSVMLKNSNSRARKVTIQAYIKGFFRQIWHAMINPYESYVDFMYYVFNLSFGMLMFYFTIIFYVQCVVFTFLIYGVGLIEPDCVIIDGHTLGDISVWVDGCWTLSWSTLTTVGYGNTAPAISESDLEAPAKCIAINTLLMLISFFGVVYSGAAGAILYSKVEKIKSEGQVSFSDPCVIRFGSGLIPIGAEEETKKTLGENNKELCPCPVLEFRILNHNHYTSMGVIANSELHCLASVEDEREKKENDHDPVIFIGEDSRVNLPRRLFSTMVLINGEHPFFRRCWTATHVINEKSPLICKKMRSIIKKNDGFWPLKYNNAKDIKRVLSFKEIIVNFTGVSKRTSKDVHAQRVYDSSDIIVGYQFINVLNKKGEDVEVRGDLLNDITEQNGDDPGEGLDYMLVNNF